MKGLVWQAQKEMRWDILKNVDSERRRVCEIEWEETLGDKKASMTEMWVQKSAATRVEEKERWVAETDLERRRECQWKHK